MQNSTPRLSAFTTSPTTSNLLSTYSRPQSPIPASNLSVTKPEPTHNVALQRRSAPKQQLGDAVRKWVSTSLRRLLRALHRLRKLSQQDEDCFRLIQIVNTIQDGALTNVVAELDTGCKVEGILISATIANRVGISWKQLEAHEYGCADGSRFRGYSSPGCLIQWRPSTHEDRHNQMFFFEQKIYESEFVVVEDLSADMIIGWPEIERVKLRQRKPLFIRYIAQPPVPNTRPEIWMIHQNSRSVGTAIRQQREAARPQPSQPSNLTQTNANAGNSSTQSGTNLQNNSS